MADSLIRSCPPRILKRVFHRFPQKRTIKISKIFTQFNRKKNKFKKLNFISKKPLDKSKDMNYNDVNNKKREKKTKNSNLKRGGDSSGKQRNHIIQNLIHYSISSE